MRVRSTLLLTMAVAVAAPLAAVAAPDATWSYDGTEATVGEAATVEITLTAPEATGEGLDPLRPMAYRHFLLDGDGNALTDTDVMWTLGEASGTATVDGDGAFLVPGDAFRAEDLESLTGDGEVQTLEVTFDAAGSYFMFSDLVEQDPGTTRTSGENRYATAAAASARGFDPGVAAVYIASGTSFADALSAGPAASHRESPLLLTAPTFLPQETREELRRLAPAEIVLVGGEAAVSAEVERDLAPYGGSVRRIAGTDRFDTAAKVARDIWFDTTVDAAYIANGRSFADALGAAAAAAIDDVPVLLVDRDTLPTSTAVTLDVLNVQFVTVAGGTAAVSSAVYTEMRDQVGAANRRFGVDRFATSAALVTREGSGRTLIVATGLDFPDALTAGPLAGALGADLLLVRPDAVPGRVAERATELAPRRVIALGGTSAINAGVLLELDDLRTPLTPLWREALIAGGDVVLNVGE